MEVPFCTGCQRDITAFNRFPRTTCFHVYCWDCVRTSRQCKLDQITWDLRTISEYPELSQAVDGYVRTHSQAMLEQLYEQINVSNVPCKHANNPRHKREVCKYDHSAIFDAQESMSWLCVTCGIKNDTGSVRCSVCATLNPAKPLIPPMNRGREVNLSPPSPRSKTPAAISQPYLSAKNPSAVPQPNPRSASTPPRAETWLCRFCGNENSDDSHLCWNCDKTNDDMKMKLDREGKSMKICPKCKKLASFTSRNCPNCKSPMTAARASPPRGQSWQCSHCNQFCSEMGSWICQHCSKTDDAQKRRLRSEGRDMIVCPNRRCQKLCPSGSTNCNGCYGPLPQFCPKCKSGLVDGQCGNCPRKEASQRCMNCGEEMYQGQCLNCQSRIGKIPGCTRCGGMMVAGKCQNCDSGRRSPTACNKCRERLVNGRCPKCERAPQRVASCPKCGLELSSSKCSNCEARKRVSPPRLIPNPDFQIYPSLPSVPGRRNSPIPRIPAAPQQHERELPARNRGREQDMPVNKAWQSRVRDERREIIRQPVIESDNTPIAVLVVAIVGLLVYMLYSQLTNKS